MAEYIKRSDVLDNIAIGRTVYPDCKKAFDGMKVEVNRFPAEDVQPVVHGKWIEKPSYEEDKEMGFEIQIVCSECDEQNSHFIFNQYHEPIEKMFIQSRFCPNCGARMDGET